MQYNSQLTCSFAVKCELDSVLNNSRYSTASAKLMQCQDTVQYSFVEN